MYERRLLCVLPRTYKLLRSASQADGVRRFFLDAVPAQVILEDGAEDGWPLDDPATALKKWFLRRELCL
jgi:hypothetical protein